MTGLSPAFARPLVDHRQNAADELRLRLAVLPPGQALGDRIHVVDPALGVGGDDRIADRLQGDLRALLGLEHRGLRLFALSDVGDRALEAGHAALFVAHHAAVVDHHEHGAVLAPQHVLLVAHLAFALHAAHVGVAVVRVPVERHGRNLVELLGR